jgi:endoglucanase
MDKTEELLKALTEADGVPGFEDEVRAVIRPRMEKLGQVEMDKLGSLVCRMNGNGPTIELVAHMDEVGFMIKHITKDGFLKFIPLGGWWDQVLLGHRVMIKTRKGDVMGVLGAKPPHLLPAEERKKVVEKKDMYIDIGACSADEVAEAGVRIGDVAVPDSDFQVLTPKKRYLSKAFDDRVGCAVLLDVLQALSEEKRPNRVVGVASVQEEVGTRGAKTSVSMVEPDVAIVLESGIAADVPGIPDEVYEEKLGGGPSVGVYDAGMIVHTKLYRLVQDIAEEAGIPIQPSFMTGGATDGRQIQQYGDGVPTIVIAVPARHIHSHNSIIHRDDYDNTVKLVTALVKSLDGVMIESLNDY